MAFVFAAGAALTEVASVAKQVGDTAASKNLIAIEGSQDAGETDYSKKNQTDNPSRRASQDAANEEGEGTKATPMAGGENIGPSMVRMQTGQQIGGMFADLGNSAAAASQSDFALMA